MFKKLICLDYGHGGLDWGASYRGRREKDDNLKFGRYLARELDSLGLDFIETRRADYYLSLEERVKICNQSLAGLVISIHRNAFIPGRARGVELYRHRATSGQNIALGRDILKALESLGFRNRGLKLGSFNILSKTQAPALILELGFIDNDEDNRLFDTRARQMAKLLASIIASNY